MWDNKLSCLCYLDQINLSSFCITEYQSPGHSYQQPSSAAALQSWILCLSQVCKDKVLVALVYTCIIMLVASLFNRTRIVCYSASTPLSHDCSIWLLIMTVAHDYHVRVLRMTVAYDYRILLSHMTDSYGCRMTIAYYYYRCLLERVSVSITFAFTEFWMCINLHQNYEVNIISACLWKCLWDLAWVYSLKSC